MTATRPVLLKLPILHTSAFVSGLALTTLLGSTPALAAQAPPPSATSLAAASGELQWRMIGPFRGGRTRAVTGVPSQPDVFYVGAVDGGVWKTDDCGTHLEAAVRRLNRRNPSVRSPSRPPMPTSSTSAAVKDCIGPISPSAMASIVRPMRAGAGASRAARREQIAELAIDPRDPDRLFVAVLGHPYGPNAERGHLPLRRWRQDLAAGAVQGHDTGGSAVAIDPTRPEVVYAALWQDRLGPWEDKNEFQGTGGGLFKSTDGGNTLA